MSVYLCQCGLTLQGWAIGLKEPEETKSPFESDGDVNYTDSRRFKGCILMADKILKEGKIIFFTEKFIIM